jgi:heavy metal translocating P-type ATPase
MPSTNHDSAVRQSSRVAALRGLGRDGLVAAAELAAIGLGVALLLTGRTAAADLVLALAVLGALVPLTWGVARTVIGGHAGVDTIALIAMAGALALGEYLAGAVIALMLSGGNALERLAEGRARRELSALLDRAPRIARKRAGTELVEVGVDAVEPGDVLVVRPGEAVPVDGIVLSDAAVLDESSLTGEPVPVDHPATAAILSGTTNAGPPFEMRASRRAADSAYAAIVRIVEQASVQRAPFVRMADRYAAVFLPVTLAVSAAAWMVSGSATRALAVLVVATPCPLILAAPIAFVAGMSRAAGEGVIVKGGAPLEALATARTAVLDKTGTLTIGHPAVVAVEAAGTTSAEEVLRLAASVDQFSVHPLAEAIVAEARRRGIALDTASAVHETSGSGVTAVVGGVDVAVGRERWVRAHTGLPEDADDPARADATVVAVSADGVLGGHILLADPLRADAGESVAALRNDGIDRVVLATGDGDAVAQAVARAVGVDEVHASQSPQDKADLVRRLTRQPARRPVVMVGDGVNDAPALALADVGVAVAGERSTVSSETADIVIVQPRIERIVLARRIARRSRSIARQSVLAGMGLSIAAMGAAAAGLISPLGGAILQEVIDVAVILNALRALQVPGVPGHVRVPGGRATKPATAGG